VSVGVLEAECDELNKRFFTYHRKRRPYIFLKWAQSGDGFLAPSKRDVKASVPVTNTFSHQLVHKMRAREMAIMIGARTLHQDDPMLNVRHWAGNDPVPVILSTESELDLTNKLFDQKRKVFILGNPNIQTSEQVSTLGQGPLSAGDIAHILYEQGIQSVLVEGGKEVLELFIKAGLWDEVWIFKAPYRHFQNGTKAPRFDSTPAKELHLSGDLLEVHKHIAH
jgi:diaminohydroxyphosphoribosylaminopyrimidine deaminase/5-amino-6-(5-phosphoribosylamino)uracil reductase